jgi:hypothetical protein
MPGFSDSTSDHVCTVVAEWQGMSDSVEPRLQPSAVTFARDVMVNVVANLVAGAIIYLLGVAAGLFPHSTQLIAASLTTVLSVTVFATFIAARFLRGNKKLYAGSVAIFLGGAANTASTFTGKNYFEPIPLWATFILGIIVMGGGIVFWVAARMVSRFGD